MTFLGEVSGIHDAVMIDTRSVADHCAVRRVGTVVCWSPINSGYAVSDPVEVPGFIDAVGVTTGWRTVCAWTAQGTVWCWAASTPGDRDANRAAVRPALVAGLVDVVQVSAGWHHVCARQRSGAVYCWGENSVLGELGDGTTASSAVPVAAPRFGDSIWLSVEESTCSLRRDGTITCLGLRFLERVPENIPPGIAGITRTKIVNGTRVCASLDSGGVECWGDQGVSGPWHSARDITDVQSDIYHLCLLRSSGRVSCLEFRYENV